MRRWWPIGAPVVAGLLAIGAAGLVSISAGQPAMAQQGDIQELARRAIGGPGGAQTVVLVPGQLASGMPVNLPTPPGSTLVGTIARDPGNGMKSWDVIMDVALVPAEAGGFYDRALPGMGWRQAPAVGDQPAPQGLFCQGDGGPWMAIAAVPVSDTVSDVRAHIESGNPGPCGGPPPQP